MTERMSRVEAVLARLGKHDPFSLALRVGLTLPAPKAVRMRFVVELVATCTTHGPTGWSRKP
jgi:hypothetical protein